MRCCICASDCRAFTTNLRKHEGLNMSKRWKRLIFIAPLAILALLVFVTIGGGLLLLCRILFGGSGWRGSARSNLRRRMEERCANMTPEERERFRQRMRERW